MPAYDIALSNTKCIAHVMQSLATAGHTRLVFGVLRSFQSRWCQGQRIFPQFPYERFGDALGLIETTLAHASPMQGNGYDQRSNKCAEHASIGQLFGNKGCERPAEQVRRVRMPTVLGRMDGGAYHVVCKGEWCKAGNFALDIRLGDGARKDIDSERAIPANRDRWREEQVEHDVPYGTYGIHTQAVYTVPGCVRYTTDTTHTCVSACACVVSI